MPALKKVLRRGANRWLAPRGLEIVNRRLESSPLEQLMLALRHFDVDLVVDVGANAGQYARELFTAGFAGEIVSIDPLPDAHAALVAAARRQPRWQVLERMAAGDCKAEVQLQVAGNSLSSSVLPMLERHVQAAPGSAPVGMITVQQHTLDEVVLERVRRSRCALLKIDTQGYEHPVLLGATRCLELVRLVQLELSLQPLYAGQKLWLELVQHMQQRGFSLWSVQPEFCDPQTGQLLQVNGLFLRD